MQNSTLPAKFQIPFAEDAGGAYINVIPVASQIGIKNGAASFTDGFPPWCFSVGGYPYGADFNGILFDISAWTQRYQAGSLIAYDGTFQSEIGGYPKGALVGSASGFAFNWISESDNNTSDPDTGGSGWIPCIPTSLLGVDTGTANALAVTVNVGLPPSVGGALLTGTPIVIRKAATANTGPCTLAVTDALGNTYSGNLVRNNGSTLAVGDLPASSVFIAVLYNSIFFVQTMVLGNLGLAAQKTVTNNSYTTVPTIGSFTTGNIYEADATGSLIDAGVTGASVASVVANAVLLPRAWAIFKDTGTVTVVSSENVASITGSSGTYTVTLSGSYDFTQGGYASGDGTAGSGTTLNGRSDTIFTGTNPSFTFEVRANISDNLAAPAVGILLQVFGN